VGARDCYKRAPYRRKQNLGFVNQQR
jgi:hypothetical protein